MLKLLNTYMINRETGSQKTLQTRPRWRSRQQKEADWLRISWDKILYPGFQTKKLYAPWFSKRGWEYQSRHSKGIRRKAEYNRRLSGCGKKRKFWYWNYPEEGKKSRGIYSKILDFKRQTVWKSGQYSWRWGCLRLWNSYWRRFGIRSEPGCL